jgi:hypothetical protein
MSVGCVFLLVGVLVFASVLCAQDVPLPPNANFGERVLEANPDSPFLHTQGIAPPLTFASPPAGGLVIVPNFNANVDQPTRDTINNIINFYETTITTPITVNINFRDMSTGLGSSFFVFYNGPYSSFRTALGAAATSPDDATALSITATGSANPINGNASIGLKSANGRAVGLNTPEVTFGSTSVCPSFTGSGCIGINVTLANSHGDLVAVVEHEIDEILGLGSALNGNTTPSIPWTQDLFRWGGPGVRSYASNPSTTLPCGGPSAFFSIDGGATNLNEFNNCANGGDYGDWITHTPSQVQDAFTNFSGTPSLTSTSAEIRALDVIGYSLNLTSPGLRFVPVTPCRLVDTRLPDGPFGGPVIGRNSSRSFAIPAAVCNIPSTAQAYALNVTVVPSGTLGFLTIWPTGQAQPAVSTLNSTDGRVKADAAIVAAGTGGAVSVFAFDETQVILDINGYFATAASAPSGLVFYPVTPCRVMDSRLANGPLGGPILVAGGTRTVPVLSSSCGVPASATAYSLNMTVVPSGPLGFLTTWPAGTSQPLVSTLNDPTGTVVANAAIVPSGTSGSINVFVTDQTHLIIDVNGYFAPPGAGGLQFYVLTPCREVDTRNPPGPFGGPALSGQRNFNLTAGACSVSPSVQAYSLNATVVPAEFLGFLTLWPAGQPQPLVSTLNSFDASIVSNAAIVPSSSGSISAFSTDTTDLILDLNGFFAP